MKTSVLQSLQMKVIRRAASATVSSAAKRWQILAWQYPVRFYPYL